MVKGFGFSDVSSQGPYRRMHRPPRNPGDEDFVAGRDQAEDRRDRLSIVGRGGDRGTCHPYYETSDWNDGCYVHDASESGHCDTSIRFGRRPRLDRRGVVGEREEKLIEEDLTHPGLTCLDRVARHLGPYRVSWQHVEGVYWGLSRSMWSSPMHSAFSSFLGPKGRLG